MSEYLVMTAIGPDRPGIVEQLSHYIVQHEGNIEDSRMAVLGGEFAAVLLVSGSDDAISRIRKDLGVLQQDARLTVAAKPTQTPRAPMQRKYIPYTAVAVSLDHKGLVHQIAHVLASAGVNVESLETATEAAPVSGTPIFSMHMDLSVPADLPIKQLRHQLDTLGAEYNIDITLNAKV